ncbi:MAG: hypothetical protein GKR89_09165 [Candidatus Latescibacteria bacterium]|nr:hypothetical protein [Candidatus Latescibacterota bacterium]
MDDLVAEVAHLDQAGALASLVWSSGSIPMSDRAKMLVRADGRVSGTIGGGCLEAEIVNAGRQVLEAGRPHFTSYTMTEQQAGESGLNCGGSVRIFTELASPVLFARLLQARQERQNCVVATLLRTDTSVQPGAGQILYYAGGERWGSLGTPAVDDLVAEQAGQILATERGQLLELDLSSQQKEALGLVDKAKVEAFVEPFSPPPVLYVFGGGHVGGQIAALAKNTGFRVVVIDDRPLFATAQRHRTADECLIAQMDGVFDDLPIDEQSYIVAATRGHQHDEIVVEGALATRARYIGMLGSERKKMVLWKRILQRGADRVRLDQVWAPIGLNIGADNPEEIAVSVVAELIKVRRGVRKEWKTKKIAIS